MAVAADKGLAVLEPAAGKGLAVEEPAAPKLAQSPATTSSSVAKMFQTLSKTPVPEIASSKTPFYDLILRFEDSTEIILFK